MSENALVPVSRGKMLVNGRLYPVALRTEAPPLDAPFERMVGDICSRLHVAGVDTTNGGLLRWLGMAGSPTAALFSAYSRDTEVMASLRWQTDRYLEKASRSAVPTVIQYSCPRCGARLWSADSRCGTRHSKTSWQDVPVRSVVQGEARRIFRLPKAPARRAFGIELASRPPEAIKGTMLAWSRADARDYVEGLVPTLDDMADHGHAGLLATENGNARYHYHTVVHLDRELDRRDSSSSVRDGWWETTTRTTERDLERTIVLRLHLHDLIDARTDPIRQYRGKVPARVRPLFEDIPWALEPMLTVVSGTQIREITGDLVLGRTQVTETHTETRSRFVGPDSGTAQLSGFVQLPRFQFDPAVVLGGVYVLAGWVPGED